MLPGPGDFLSDWGQGRQLSDSQNPPEGWVRCVARSMPSPNLSLPGVEAGTLSKPPSTTPPRGRSNLLATDDIPERVAGGSPIPAQALYCTFPAYLGWTRGRGGVGSRPARWAGLRSGFRPGHRIRLSADAWSDALALSLLAPPSVGRQGRLPKRLQPFLEWCALLERGWLPLSDAREFRHRELLDHLASETETDGEG